VFEGHQPPLYYALAALGMRVLGLDAPPSGVPPPNVEGGDALFYRHARFGFLRSDALTHPVLGPRLVSIAFGAFACAFAYVLGTVIFPGWPLGGFATALASCFVPQAIAISSAAGNDALAMAIGTAVLLWSAVCLRKGEVSPAAAAALGALAGLAVLAKLNVLPVFGAALVPLVRCRTEPRRIALATVVAVLVGAWWPIYNWARFDDPVLSTLQAERLSNLLSPPPDWTWWRDQFAPLTWRSYWGLFGWMNVIMPDWFYELALGLVVVLALGAVIAALTRHAVSRAALVSMAVAVAGVGVALVQYNASGYLQPQGRLLFPAAAGIGALAAYGVYGWAAVTRNAAVWILAAILLAMNVAALDVLSALRHAS
jgi:hypothetical protein